MTCLFGMGGVSRVCALILVFVQFYLEHIASIIVSGLEKLITQLQAYILRTYRYISCLLSIFSMEFPGYIRGKGYT